MSGNGIGSYVAFKEASGATFQEPDVDILFSKEDIKESPGRINTSTWRGGQRFKSKDRVGKRSWGGSVTSELTGSLAGLLLPHALGGTKTVSTDDPSSGRNTISLTAGNLPAETLSVKVGRSTIDGTLDHNNYGGGRLTELAIEAGQDDSISCVPSFSFSNYDGDTSTTSVSAYTPGSVDYWSPLYLLDSTVTFDIGGDNVELCLDDWKLSIKRDLETERFKTCGLQPAVDKGFVDVSGEGTMDFEDRRFKDLFVEAEVFDLRILAGNALGEKVQFDLKCQLGDDANVNIDGPGLLKQKIPFMVVDDPGATLAETCSVEIIESVAGL